MITKNEEEDLMNEAIGSEINDYLLKPLNPNQLLISVKKVLENSIIIQNKLSNQSIQKEKLFRKLLIHPLIEDVRGKGLMIALIMKNEKLANQLVINALDKGLVLFWLLYEKKAVRITPPLTISNSEIKKGCNIILSILDLV